MLKKQNNASTALKRELEAKSIKITKVRQIVLDSISVEFFLLNPAVPEIFYFKHDEGASLIIIFIGNPNVDNICDAFLVLSQGQPKLD